ncbi:hypothetical protein RHODO2019_04925 [Rhodococcus antarcticus]|uniref:Uncharacterized protein n=1 Tax=Rhodococcus antarcticus TaxID=2987751 RepID=A0ABY6P2Q2_9NOCA|nr:hypothetical protein [Rhodococcus antarcticus]UZJ25789.1 hypothetical protein RHODO2019_04925 [Rhodococcus antarcticus]
MGATVPTTCYGSRTIKLRDLAVLGSAVTVAAGLALGTGSALASGPPAAATAFASAIITPDGGQVSGFGITATFAPGAVTSPRLIILGNWPNGLDVTPPSGTAVKTFGLQECNTDATGCTSELGNFPNSPAGTQKIHGQTFDYTAGHPLPDAAGNTNFGTAGNKLVTITARTGANQVYVYNANNTTTAAAYPKLLPSTSDGSTLSFQTFQPFVWVETAPTS